MNKVNNIAIFASGGGSNAEAIIRYFSRVDEVNISLIITNNDNAGVLERAKSHGIPSKVHTKEQAENGEILSWLKEMRIDFVVLAGYLKKIGDDLLAAYPNKIVNVHPALLPKFGGKGMYGMNVHRAVKEANETESGPTIHFVNEHYDEGAIIEQYKCQLEANDTAEDIAKKVLALEHEYFPKVIAQVIQESNGI